jgi:hypothetical protein
MCNSTFVRRTELTISASAMLWLLLRAEMLIASIYVLFRLELKRFSMAIFPRIDCPRPIILKVVLVSTLIFSLQLFKFILLHKIRKVSAALGSFE